MEKMKDNYAFIDGQNLNLSIKEQKRIIDLRRFRVYLKDKFKVEKAYYFLGYLNGNESLYTFLQEAGYVVVFKPILEVNGIIKGNCDAELVLHTMIHYSNYNKAIIVSGDGDFHCLVEYLDNNDKLLAVGIPNKFKYSSLLKGFKEKFFYISDFRHKFEYKKSRHSVGHGHRG